MNLRCFARGHRLALLTGLGVLLGSALTGCASAEELGRAEARHDASTCESFGTHYGSPAYSRCMLTQQRRRDTATLDALERQRISAEIARNNVETVRRMRCEREARRERESGGRPRPCW
jgi:hypothetical protein